MAVLYNMDAFSALKILYRGKTDGFPEEDFTINEQTRGIILPPVLKRFLCEYGYMPVNRFSDSVRFIHPNIMSLRKFTYGNETALPLIIVGRVGEFEIAIADGMVDPTICLLRISPEQIQILPSDDTLTEIFKVMTTGLILRTDGTIIAEEPQVAVDMMKENGFDLNRINHNPRLRREYSISFSDVTRTFMTVEFSDGEFERFIFLGNEKYINNL